MTRTLSDILLTADAALARQSVEIAATQVRQQRAVTAKTSTGGADIDATFSLDVRFRLVFIRCHFAGGSGTAPLTISLDSAQGSAHDTLLFTIIKAGTGRDVHLRIPADESRDPSPWTFQTGDSIRIQWTNADWGNTTWGLEVGLAIAS